MSAARTATHRLGAPPQPLAPERLPDHLDRLYSAAWALCGSREEAEDLVQDTYLRVLAKPRVLAGGSEFGYLLRALRNTHFTRLRTQGRRPSTVPLPDDPGLVADQRAVRPEDAVAARELYAEVAALPDEFRDVLVAVDVAGLSYKETARSLRIRPGTVMSRLYRARRRLADKLGVDEAGE